MLESENETVSMHFLFFGIYFLQLSSYLIYLSISVVASVSLGPSVLLAANNSINFGRKKALFGVLGHVTAILTLALVSASSLGAILLTSEIAFSIIKYLGAAYLIFLGIKLWRSQSNMMFDDSNKLIPSKLKLFRQSYFLGLSNPKALLFFSALFPQFIQPNSPLIPQFSLLIGTSLVNAFLFTSFYVFIAFQFKDKILKFANGKLLGRVFGSLFISFAGLLIAGK